MARKLDFPVFDADNHMYETTDAFTKYLPEEYAGLIKYVEVNGRTKIAIKQHDQRLHPEPHLRRWRPPGAQEEFSQERQPEDARPRRELMPPPRYIESPAAFFEPGPGSS